MEFSVLKYVSEELHPNTMTGLLALIAKIESKTKLEVLYQVLTILNDTKNKKLELTDAIEILTEWARDVETDYIENIVLDDPTFQAYIKKLYEKPEMVKNEETR